MGIGLIHPVAGPSKLDKKDLILELLFLAVVLWVAHFYHFRSMGLYEDDYSHTSLVLGWKLSDLTDWIRGSFLWWDLGRPLGFSLGPLLAFIGSKLGGLGGIYVVAYMVQLTNGVLFYWLLRRIGHGGIALLGALVFGLFPADTTHSFLMHALGLHTSLTFLLLACHSYLGGQRSLAYLLSVGCLLTYESPYLVFLAAPLLFRPWDRKLLREILKHVGIWVGILLVIVAVRAAMAESRIEAAGSSFPALLTATRHVLASLVIGPAVSLSMFWRGPAWTFGHWNDELSIVFAACLPVFSLVLGRLANGIRRQQSAATDSFSLGPSRRLPWLHLTIPYPHVGRLLLTGLIMLSLAYGFSFTHYPPTTTYGRLTSVHLAAAFGAALVFAAVGSILLTLARTRWLYVCATIFLAAYLSWVVTYRFSIQQDFVKAWLNQRAFWSAVAQQTPDLENGTIILVTGSTVPATHFIATLSWANPIVLEQIFRFPASWSTPPRLFVVSPNWSKGVIRENGQLLWPVPGATWDAHWEVLPDSNVVLLGVRNYELYRQFGSLKLNRLTLNLKPLPPAPSPPWPTGPLYPLLLPASQ